MSSTPQTFKDFSFVSKPRHSPVCEMKRLSQALTPDTSIPAQMLPAHPSRTFALDSFKKSYAKTQQNPKSARPRAKSGGGGDRGNMGQHQPREFTRLTKVLHINEEGSDGSDDQDDQANDAETEELMKIRSRKNTKNATTYYPTDAILQRHLNSGKLDVGSRVWLYSGT